MSKNAGVEERSLPDVSLCKYSGTASLIETPEGKGAKPLYFIVFLAFCQQISGSFHSTPVGCRILPVRLDVFLPPVFQF